MLSGYAALFRQFRDEDFVAFAERHDRLYAEARRSGDHREVVRAFYSLMARVMAATYGPDWHFCPPEHPRQSRFDATRALHRRLAGEARLERGKRGLDVGSGVGGAMLDLALGQGLDMTGITMGENEVDTANAEARRLGIEDRCRAVQGDMQAMPFAAGSFDGGYAIYAFKYLPTLDPVFGEIARVVRPGGRFAIYDIVKTDRYDERDPEHARIVHGFEYACAMPDLHTVGSMAEAALRHGLAEVSRTDLSTRHPWYHYLAAPPLPWLVSSPTVARVIERLERVGLLPRGFADFNSRFASGIVHSLLQGGRRGILSGSALLVLERRGAAGSPR